MNIQLLILENLIKEISLIYAVGTLSKEADLQNPVFY